jgi:hypothetical protein
MREPRRSERKRNQTQFPDATEDTHRDQSAQAQATEVDHPQPPGMPSAA